MRSNESGVGRTLAPFFLCSILLLSGCVSYPQTRAILAAPPSDLPHSKLLEHVPFVAQEDYFCGPAAMSMILQAQDINPNLEDLISMVYVPERDGSFQIELKAAARRFGLIPYEISPDMESVFREVDNGNPVLILQNLGLEIAPTWHYAIVVGYDLPEKKVILHSGLEQNTRIAIGTFERTWAQYAKGWALVMLPPDQTPVTAEPFKFQKSIEDFVELGLTPTALQAYSTARKTWPNNALLAFGQGNLLYSEQSYSDATGAYLDALRVEHEDAKTWNNLAYALAQLGCSDALYASQCAIQLDQKSKMYSSTPKETRQILQNVRPTKDREDSSYTCPVLPSCPTQDD